MITYTLIHTYILAHTHQTLEHKYISTYKHTYTHSNTVRHTYMPAPYTQTQTSKQKSAGYIDHVSISVRVYICLRVSMYCRTQRWCTFLSTSFLFFYGIQVLWQPRIGQTSVSTTNIQTCKLSRLSPTEKGGKKDSIMRGEVSIRETIGDTPTLAKLKKRNKFWITRG